MKLNDSVPRKNSKNFAALKNEPTAEDIEDRALESTLVVLLSSLEFLRAQMEAGVAQQQPAQVVEAATALVNQVVAFVDKQVSIRVDAEDLARALAKVGDFFTTTQLAQEHLERPALKSLFGWLTKAAAGTAEHRARLRQVARGLDDVLESYFNLFAARFRGVHAAQRWMDTQEVFRADLKRVLDQLK
jgi:hypothetical protein